MLRLIIRSLRITLAAMALFLCTCVQAVPTLFTVDTSTLAGTSARLAFDFIGDQGNVAVVRNFQSAFTPGAQQAIGNVTGTLPGDLTLRTSSSFLNEFIVDLTLGSRIAFELHLSGDGPAAGATPDAFSLFLLDTLSGLPLFSTSDPTGADSLFRIDIDGSSNGALSIFSTGDILVSAEPLVQEIPAPSTLLLAVPLILFLALRRHGRAVWQCAGLLLLMGGGTMAAHAQEDLTPYVSVSKSGAVLNRTSGTYDYIVSVTNTSADAILAPLTLGITNIAGPEVAVYNVTGRDENDFPQVRAALDSGVLEPGASVKVPVRFLNPRSVPISYAVTVTGTVLTAADSVSLKVRAFSYSGNEDSPAGAPAGAGIALLINGVILGVTDSAGEANLVVPADAESISAQRAPTTVGSALLELAPGQANTVDIIVNDDGQVYADGVPRVDEVRQLLLPRTFSSFTGRITDPRGATVRLAQLASVDRHDSIGTPLGSITPLFALSADGTFRPANLAALRNLFNTQQGRITLTITGIDHANNVHIGDVSFYLSSNPVSGRLAAPPSSPGLRLNAIRVVGKILNADIVVSTVTDSEGRFAFPDLPNGNLSIGVETLQNDRYYYGSGVYTLTGPTALVVPLATAAENLGASLAAGLAAAADKARAQSTVVGVNARRPEDLRDHTPRALPAPAADKPGRSAFATDASVSVTAGTQNVPSTQTARLTVAKGTAKVTLTYIVASEEYPYYVTQQSIFNDVWGIRVFGGTQGARLFDITHQVNSQLTQPPLWLPNGTTGVIERSFDVTALAKNGDVEISLTAFATNIGDSRLPTGVNATITASDGLSINSVTNLPDSWVARNDGSYYSVPITGDRNVFHRKVRLNITKPPGATVTNLKVELLGAGNDATVLDTAPNADVVLLGQTGVRSVITFKLEASTVNSVPPPTNLHQYRYTLKAKDAAGNELTAEKIESGKHPLWRMPEGIARFGAPHDPGRDDWTSRRTYLWMDQHRDLLRPVNDVSGEHGKDLGHKTHARGNDIDMYHFYTFPGANANSGTSNYNRLVAYISALPKQDSQNPQERAIGTAAAGQVQAWIVATRDGMDRLAAEPDVQQIGYIQAGPGPVAGVSGSWGETLLKTGKITVAGKEYEVVKGSWTNAKYFAWPGHHHHVHVTLAPDL